MSSAAATSASTLAAKQRLAATAVGATATAAKEAAERREWQHKEGTAKTASLSATFVAGRGSSKRGEGGGEGTVNAPFVEPCWHARVGFRAA